MANKELKFEAVLDASSFARVKRALGELTTEAQKLAKALSGTGGLFSGANVGNPPTAVQTQGRGQGGYTNQPKTSIGAAILGDVNSFQKLASSGKAGMDAMTSAVRAGVREQMREIERLEGKMATLQARFAKDPRAAYEGAFRANLQTQMLTRQGQLGTAQGQLGALQAAQAGLMPTAGGAGGGGGLISNIGAAFQPGGGGFVGAGQAVMQSLMGPGMAAMIARSVGLAAGGAMGILNTSVSADQLGLTQEARRGQALRPMIDRMKRGDISDQMALYGLKTMKSGEERAELFRSVFGADAVARSKAVAALGLAKSVGTLGVAGDINQGLVGTFGQSTQGTEQIEGMGKLIEAYKQTADSQLRGQRYLDFVESTAGARIGSSRMVGLGMYRDRKTNELDTKRTQQYKNFLTLNEQQAISGEAVVAGMVESRNLTGTVQFGREMALTAASGFGGFNQVRGAAARMGDASLANLAMGGGINKAAGIQLGQGMLGTGFDPRGTVSAAGALNAFQGGYGGLMGPGTEASHFNLVQQAMAGMGVGDALTAGRTSGWQTGMNLLGAMRANPGGDAYTSDYLATGMTFKQMLAGASGNLTETAKMSGITSGMMKEQLGNVAEGALSLWVDTGAMDKRSMAMRKYKASGKSANEFLTTSSDEDAKAMAVQLGMMNPEFGEEGSIGFMRMLRGQGAKGVKGATPIGGIDDQTKAMADRKVKELEDTFGTLKEFFGAEGTITKGFGDWRKSIDAMADLNTSAEKLAHTFGVLAGMTEEQIKKSLGSGAVSAVKENIVNPVKKFLPKVF